MSYFSKSFSGNKNPVLIDGSRSAFVKSFGVFEDIDGLELYSRVVSGLLRKLEIPVEEIDEISAGVVLPQTKNLNIARDTALNLSLPMHIHGATTGRACTSSLHTICDAVKTIAYGQPHFVLAGGLEVLSDVPIVYSKRARKFLTKLAKARSLAAKISVLRQFSLKAWLPQPPSLSEPLTGLTMGQHAEVMAKKNQISRQEQDEFALLSHKRAHKAQQDGFFKQEIIPVWPSPGFKVCVDEDNIIRGDTTLDKLTSLKAVFDKKYGTITAGNASPITDGAAICLIGDEERSNSLGLKIKAKIKDFCWVGCDPNDQLLIGPAIAIPMLLKRNNLQIQDIDLFEIHEAFAAQVLSCLRSMESKEFNKQYFGDPQAFGSIPIEKLNIHGGAIAIGHPFGATGARLVNTMANALIHTNKNLGVISICAAGGMAGAMLIERQ